MRTILRCHLLLVVMIFLAACRPADVPSRVDYEALPAFSGAGVINVVVEIPAGTNRRVRYRPAIGDFVVDQTDGADRVIRFLSYPGNYGFVPATTPDAPGVLLLSESRPTGSVVPALPIAALRLEEGGAIDTKIIAVPVDSMRRIIPVTTFRDFLIQYDGAKRIVEEWFLHYEGLGKVQLLGWEDERYALEEIRRRARQ